MLTKRSLVRSPNPQNCEAISVQPADARAAHEYQPAKRMVMVVVVGVLYGLWHGHARVHSSIRRVRTFVRALDDIRTLAVAVRRLIHHTPAHLCGVGQTVLASAHALDAHTCSHYGRFSAAMHRDTIGMTHPFAHTCTHFYLAAYMVALYMCSRLCDLLIMLLDLCDLWRCRAHL